MKWKFRSCSPAHYGDPTLLTTQDTSGDLQKPEIWTLNTLCCWGDSRMGWFVFRRVASRKVDRDRLLILQGWDGKPEVGPTPAGFTTYCTLPSNGTSDSRLAKITPEIPRPSLKSFLFLSMWRWAGLGTHNASFSMAPLDPLTFTHLWWWVTSTEGCVRNVISTSSA